MNEFSKKEDIMDRNISKNALAGTAVKPRRGQLGTRCCGLFIGVAIALVPNLVVAQTDAAISGTKDISAATMHE